MKKETAPLPQKFKQGLALLNQGEFYDAHEYFEDAWRETQDTSREFYRALLHISGGFFRLSQDRPKAAKKFFTHALKWLQEFPSPYKGFNTKTLIKYLNSLIEAIDQKKKSEIIISQYFVPINPENQKRNP